MLTLRGSKRKISFEKKLLAKFEKDQKFNDRRVIFAAWFLSPVHHSALSHSFKKYQAGLKLKKKKQKTFSNKKPLKITKKKKELNVCQKRNKSESRKKNSQN